MNYIYGTGERCNYFINEGFIDLDKVDGFVQTNKTVDIYMGKPMYSIDQIEMDSIQNIIISIINSGEICKICFENNISVEKLGSFYPNSYLIDTERNLNVLSSVLTPKGYTYFQTYYQNYKGDWVKTDALRYQELNSRPTMKIDSKYDYYIYNDKSSQAGTISNYFWQDLWAAKKIIKQAPKIHYDIGSRLDGFISHLLAAEIKVDLIDIRPLDHKVEGLGFVCADATNLDNIENQSLESLSALSSIEHFGLGRYGDAIDPEACFKAFSAIQKKVMSGGNIYISVPVGMEHVEFNAHRVFYASTIKDAFDGCKLIEYSCTEGCEFEEDVDVHKYDNDFQKGGGRYGLFHFVKK